VARFVASRATETTTGASPSENSSRIGVGSASIVNRRRSTEPGIQKTRSGAIPASRQRDSICRDTANTAAVRR